MQINAYNEFLEASLRNMTTREIIKYCENNPDNPIIRELARRLELCLDFTNKQVGL